MFQIGALMKAVFLNLESWTTRIAMALACLMLAIASGLAVFQVITRFVLEQPAEWTEVLIRFSLIWMVFMGIPMAFRQGAMVSVDALYRAVPTHIKRVLDLVVALAALAQGKRAAQTAGMCRLLGSNVWKCDGGYAL